MDTNISNCSLIYCAASDVWVDEPTDNGVIIYSIITPILAACGVVGNALSLLIISRNEFSSSIYTYLSVLAITDIVSAIFLLISGLCRGVLWWAPGWSEYEAIIAIPFGGTFSCWAVFAIVAVTFDRVVYLWRPTRTRRPHVCQPRVARLVMFASLCISVLFNVPYCFMYEWDYDGTLIITAFVKSSFYTVHSWVKLIVFAITPACLLIIGNVFLIISIKRLYHMKSKCRQRCNKKTKKSRDQKWITVALIAMVFFFLIGAIPSHLVSRASAVVILFWGNEELASASKPLEWMRQAAALMSGIYLAMNFFVYYMFCAQFRRCMNAMKGCWRKRRAPQPPPPPVTQVNVFIVGKFPSTSSTTPSITQFNWRLFNLLEENQLAANIVTSSKIY